MKERAPSVRNTEQPTTDNQPGSPLVGGSERVQGYASAASPRPYQVAVTSTWGSQTSVSSLTTKDTGNTWEHIPAAHGDRDAWGSQAH